MNDPSILTTLANHGFTKSLDELFRARLAEGAIPFTANSGEQLFCEGEPADSFYLIQSGHVEIGLHLAERGSTLVQRVGGGDVVGWSWLLPPYRCQFDARAVDSVEGLRFDASWLREQCERDPALGYQLLKHLLGVIGGRLAATRLQRMDLYR